MANDMCRESELHRSKKKEIEIGSWLISRCSDRNTQTGGSNPSSRSGPGTVSASHRIEGVLEYNKSLELSPKCGMEPWVRTIERSGAV
jgi:hypothetical protein